MKIVRRPGTLSFELVKSRGLFPACFYDERVHDFCLFALIIKGYRRDVFITERLMRKEEIALSTVKHVLFEKKNIRIWAHFPKFSIGARTCKETGSKRRVFYKNTNL